jgi:hypothetical protein
VCLGAYTSTRAPEDFKARVLWDGLVVSVRRFYERNEFPGWRMWDRIVNDMVELGPGKWLAVRIARNHGRSGRCSNET